MERSVFIAMLDEAPGVTRASAGYEIQEDYRLRLYVGNPGDSMVVSDVATLRLADGFVTAESRDDGSTYMVAYEDLHAVSVRPPRGAAGRRAGFS